MRALRQTVPHRGQPAVGHLKPARWEASFQAAVDLLRRAPAGYAPPVFEPSRTAPLPDTDLTQRIEWLAQRIPAGSRILDLGCGRGEVLHFLGRRFPGDHLGLERDPEFLERCRSIGVRAIPSDFNDPADPALRFACSQGWDVVLIIDSMVYWRYPAVVLAALQDRCKRIYVTVNNAAHLRSRVELLAGTIAERPNMRGDAFSTDWYANRWSVRGFQAWGEALGYATRPLARRSVSAKYLPLWVLPGVFARSVLFELTPQGSSHADQGN